MYILCTPLLMTNLIQIKHHRNIELAALGSWNCCSVLTNVWKALQTFFKLKWVRGIAYFNWYQEIISLKQIEHFQVLMVIFYECRELEGKKGIIGFHKFQCSKMKFSIKDFYSKCDQIRRKLTENLLNVRI